MNVKEEVDEEVQIMASPSKLQEKIDSPPKAQAKYPTFETPFQTPQFFKNTIEVASNHYDQFKMKKSRFLMGTPLSFRNHPSLQDIPEISEEFRSF